MRSFYKASVPYPHSASSPSRRTKNNTPLVELAKVWRGCRNAVVGVGASLRRLWATAIVHPCTSCLLCWFRVVPRQPFGLPHRVATKCADFKHPCLKLWASTITHPCVCGRLGRCIVQRLCATAIVHPLHVYERSVGFASCLVSRLGCHIVWQLSAAAFKHPCLKLWAFIL